MTKIKKFKKQDTYKIITDKIIESLENDIIPWQKPWKGGTEGNRNLITGKTYRGINAFLLNCAPFSSPYWLTYKQAKAQGGNVIKGQKGMPVTFWRISTYKTEEEGEIIEKGSFLLKHYTVFNLEQTENVKLPSKREQEINAKEEGKMEFSPIKSAEKLLSELQHLPEIKHGEPRAYYHPARDYINMPEKGLFNAEAEYYSTLFHEIGHSTGSENRLRRFNSAKHDDFASENYSREELTAEFYSAFLSGFAGLEVETIENNTAYIQGWLKALKNDKKLAIQAAGRAQKASDYSLGIKHNKKEEATLKVA